MSKIAKFAQEALCSIWFTLCGVNASEMFIWNKLAFLVIPKYDDEGRVIGIRKKRVHLTSFIRIPKQHGMFQEFLMGHIIPCLIVQSQKATWGLDTEAKALIAKLLNINLLNEWKRDVLAGKKLPNSSPILAWFHPTANRQPESLLYLSTPERIGEFLGMDPYKQFERLNKALQPASTTCSWQIVGSNIKKLRLLSVDSDSMNLVFGNKARSTEDGPIILRDYAVKVKPFVSRVAHALFEIPKTEYLRNPAMQIRFRREAVKNGKPARMVTKACQFGSEEAFQSLCDLFKVPEEIRETLHGVSRDDNFKSKNVKPGDIIEVEVTSWEVAKLASWKDDCSSSLGTQAMVGDQEKFEILHREHAWTEMLMPDGSVQKMYTAAVWRDALNLDLYANFHILNGEKEISMEDFKSATLNTVCNAVLNKATGRLEVLRADSYLNVLMARWLRYYRSKVVTAQCSRWSPYNGAVPIYTLGQDERKSVINLMDEVKYRHKRETGEDILPCLFPRPMLEQLVKEGWRYINLKKDPQTSAIAVQGATFVERLPDGTYSVLGIDMQEEGFLDRVAFNDCPNAIGTPTSFDFGTDKDGDLLSVLLSKLMHMGAKPPLFSRFEGKGEKAAKIEFTRPTTHEEWEDYVDAINAQYDGYTIAAVNTGNADLEARLQCAVAHVRGDLDNGIPLTLQKHRDMNYAREELAIKIGKHGIGGKSGSVYQDPIELIRSLGYGEIPFWQWPNIYKATHKYGGVSSALGRNGLPKRSDKRLVLNTILGAIWNQERFRTVNGNGVKVKIPFFLDYAFKIIRKGRDKKFHVPWQDIKQVNDLKNEYRRLFHSEAGKLDGKFIFNANDVKKFVGIVVKPRQGIYEGIRGKYAELSSSYLSSATKRQDYEGLISAFTFVLSYFIYNRGPESRGLWGVDRAMREYACHKFLRFKPHRELLLKELEQHQRDAARRKADLEPLDPILTLEEEALLEELGWLDRGVTDTNGEFHVFEHGLKTKLTKHITQIGSVLSNFPKFHKIDEHTERIKQIDMFCMLSIMYLGEVGFGSGHGRNGDPFTRVPALLSCFKPEIMVEVARLRYKALGVECHILDKLPALWEISDLYIAAHGANNSDYEEE